MFTNNYIKYREMMFCCSRDVYGFVNMTGSTHQASASYSAGSDFGTYMRFGYCATPNTNTPGVYFGSGSTPATREDYKLESVITSGLTITNPSNVAITTEGDGKYIAQSVFTVHNNSDADITIGEIGYYAKTLNGTSLIYIDLFDRTVLDEPVTIPAGQGKIIIYKIVFKQS